MPKPRKRRSLGSNEEKISKDETNTSQRTNTDVEPQKTMESPVSTDPSASKRLKLGKMKDRQYDKYCWICHKEEECVQKCSLCPRVFHLECVNRTEVLVGDWMCPECLSVTMADKKNSASSVSPIMALLTSEQFCNLLKYSLHRMEIHIPKDFTFVDSSLVFYPMDFSILEKNIRKKAYTSTASFLADVKWIVHNHSVYYPLGIPVIKTMFKVCQEELREIETCPDCYLHAYSMKDKWFSEPCRKPHTLVWAKLKGFPIWPAKAVKASNGNVDVRFFGGHERAWVPVGHVYFLSRDPPQPITSQKKNFEIALQEVELHIKLLGQRFGTFEYAPNKTPFNPTQLYLHLNIVLNKLCHTPQSSREKRKYEAPCVSSKRRTGKSQELLGGKKEDQKKDDNELDDCFEEQDSNNKMDGTEDQMTTVSTLDNEDMSGYGSPFISIEGDKDEVQEDTSGNPKQTRDSLDFNNDLQNTDIEIQIETIEVIIGNNNDVLNKTDESNLIDQDDIQDSEETSNSSRQELQKSYSNECINQSRCVDDHVNGNYTSTIKSVSSDLNDKTSREGLSPIKIIHQDINKEKIAISLNFNSDVVNIKEKDSIEHNPKDTRNTDTDANEIGTSLNPGENQDESNENNNLNDNGVTDDKSMEDNNPLHTNKNGNNEEEMSIVEKSRNNEMTEQKLSLNNIEKDSPQHNSQVEVEQNDDQMNCEHDKDTETNIKETNEISVQENNIIQSNLDVHTVTEKEDGCSEDSSSDQIIEKEAGSSNVEDNLDNDETELERNSQRSESDVCVDDSSKANFAENENTTDEKDNEGSDSPVVAVRKSKRPRKNFIIQFPYNTSKNSNQDSSKGSPSLNSKNVTATEEKETVSSSNTDTSNSLKATSYNKRNVASPIKIEVSSKKSTNMVSISSLQESESVDSSKTESPKSKCLNVLDPMKIIVAENKTLDIKQPSSVSTTLSQSVTAQDQHREITDLLKSKSLDITVHPTKCSDTGNTIKTILIQSKDDDSNVLMQSNITDSSKLVLQDKCSENTKQLSNYMEKSLKPSHLNIMLGKVDHIKIIKNIPHNISTLIPKDVQTCEIQKTIIQQAKPTCTSTVSSPHNKISVQLINKNSVPVTHGDPLVSYATKNFETIHDKSIKKTIQIPSGISVSDVTNKNISSNIGACRTGNLRNRESDHDMDCMNDDNGSVVKVSDNHTKNVLLGGQEDGTNNNQPSTQNVQSSAVKDNVSQNTRTESAAGSSSQTDTSQNAQQSSCTTEKNLFSILPVEKYARKLTVFLTNTLEEMCQDIINSGCMQVAIHSLETEIENLREKHKKEKLDIKQNADLIVKELRATMETEKQNAISEVRRQCEIEMRKSVDETKKKQWCANCGKEAVFYCCWNTSYCDYPCQQAHWPQHMSLCGQNAVPQVKEPLVTNMPNLGPEMTITQSTPVHGTLPVRIQPYAQVTQTNKQKLVARRKSRTISQSPTTSIQSTDVTLTAHPTSQLLSNSYTIQTGQIIPVSIQHNTSSHSKQCTQTSTLEMKSHNLPIHQMSFPFNPHLCL